MVTETDNPVRRRRVFYLPGYDPNPARRYRELFRTESVKQGALSGYDIRIKGRPSREAYGWDAIGTFGDDKVLTRFEVLQWTDIVQSSMSQSIGGTYLQLLKTAWIYLSTGTLRRLTWLRKGPVIAALYPIVVLILQALVALIVGRMIGSAVSNLIWPGVGWILALPLIVLILRWFYKIDRKVFAYYLMHDYAFAAQYYGENPPELDVRLEQFREKITAALDSDVDEVLIVGHSSGAQLAVNLLADLLRERDEPFEPALALLSLGQAIPMVSFLPRARKLRADLNFLSQSARLTWVDVSAPGDGCSFALCDPVAVSGVAPENQRWPLVISAAFSQTLSPERLTELKHRYFRLHFQYLCAFDRPGDYDYFQISAGPQTLGDRYRDRKPSQSRIDVAAAYYTSMKV